MKAASYNDVADCPFCGIEPSRVIRASALTIAFWDGFPVSAGHALVMPRRHVISWADTTLEEKHELVSAIDVVRALVDKRIAAVSLTSLGLVDRGKVAQGTRRHRKPQAATGLPRPTRAAIIGCQV